MQRLHDLLIRTTRQVCPADGTGKQGIAGDELLIALEVQANAAFRVPRCVQDIGHDVAGSDFVTSADAAVDGDRPGTLHSDPGGLHIEHFEERVIVLVEQDRCARRLFQLHGSADVVDMSMCDDDLLHGQPVLANNVEDIIDIVAWIDHHRFSCLFVPNHGTVALQHADRKDLMDHGSRVTRILPTRQVGHDLRSTCGKVRRMESAPSTGAVVSSKNITLWFLTCLLLFFGAVALLILWPFLRTIAAALIVAVVFFPAYRLVLRWTGRRPTWASLIMTLGIVVLFLFPVSLILLRATNEALIAAQRLSILSAEQGGLGLFLMTLAERPLHFLARFIDVSKLDIHSAITGNVQRAGLLVLSSGAAILGSLARLTASFFFMLILLFFLFRDGQKWVEGLGSLMPLAPAQTRELFQNIANTIIGNVYGIVSVGLVQGVLTGVAIAIVGLPSPLLLGIAAFFASILPVIGAALVWIPAALYLMFSGAIWKGVFVLLWGAVVISTADNVVRPWVVSGKVELHPLVLMFVILGGVQLFGFLGLFLGPVIVSVLAAVFHMLREELGYHRVESAAGASQMH